MLGRVLSAAAAAVASRAVYDAVRARGRRRRGGSAPTIGARRSPWRRVLPSPWGRLVGVVVPRPVLAPSQRAASTLAVGGASALGMIDDLTGATDVKGLRGHLGALRHGEVTTGTVKLVRARRRRGWLPERWRAGAAGVWSMPCWQVRSLPAARTWPTCSTSDRAGPPRSSSRRRRRPSSSAGSAGAVLCRTARAERHGAAARGPRRAVDAR